MAYLVSILTRYFRKRAPSIRKRLQTLAQDSVTERAASNLWTDSRPATMAWRAIARAVVRARNDAADVQNAIRSGIAAARSRGAKSPRARIAAKSMRFGRVITESDYFSRLLYPGSSASPTARANDPFFRALLAATLDRQRIIMERRPLGKWAMWSTWSASNPVDESPFVDIPDDAKSLRAALALDDAPSAAEDVLLLFEYRLPDHVIPRIPTVCDAYAGPSWPAYFLPSPPGARHGYTDPWENSGMDRRPEVVHEIITGATIAEKIRRVVG